jgi:predicted nucleotidyltransferase
VNKKEHYLSIDKTRDVIEYPIIDLIDINGWDLRKSLSLFQKSNPTFSEWIKSPIIYYKNTDFREKVLELEKQYFSPK